MNFAAMKVAITTKAILNTAGGANAAMAAPSDAQHRGQRPRPDDARYDEAFGTNR